MAATSKKISTAVAVCALFFAAGCPSTPQPEVLSANLQKARQNIYGLGLNEVIDGPGAGEVYEKYVERRQVVGVVGAIGGMPEEWLREQADDFTYQGLLDNPENHRGKMMFAYLVVGQLEDLSFRADGERLQVMIGGTPQGEFYAYIYPLKRGRGRLYGGDFVWCTGVFVKVFSFVDGTGVRRRIPLFVGPPPTYTKDWFPYKPLLKELGLEDFFPVKLDTSPPPPALFVDIDDGGLINVDGRLYGRDELKRRMDGLVEAAGIRNTKAVVVVRPYGWVRNDAVEFIHAEAAVRNLSVLMRQPAMSELDELILQQVSE